MARAEEFKHSSANSRADSPVSLISFKPAVVTVLKLKLHNSTDSLRRSSNEMHAFDRGRQPSSSYC
jgi:hypothetical protein